MAKNQLNARQKAEVKRLRKKNQDEDNIGNKVRSFFGIEGESRIKEVKKNLRRRGK